MSYEIEDIQGIGFAFSDRLRVAQIQTAEDFLKHCCDAKGRRRVSELTGLNESLLLNWANKAGLMRISGIGPQFSELLEAAGVDTVREFRYRNAENLAAKMAEVNAKRNLSGTSPAASVVEAWIVQAKSLPPGRAH